MSILTSFQAEHDAILRAADKWKDGQINDRELLDSLKELMRVHFRDEEEILYPEIPYVQGNKPVAAYVDEHREVGKLAQRIEDALDAAGDRAAEDPTAHSLLGEVIPAIQGHIKYEEEEMFKVAKTRLSSEKLKDLQARRYECSCRGH